MSDELPDDDYADAVKGIDVPDFVEDYIEAYRDVCRRDPDRGGGHRERGKAADALRDAIRRAIYDAEQGVRAALPATPATTSLVGRIDEDGCCVGCGRSVQASPCCPDYVAPPAPKFDAKCPVCSDASLSQFARTDLITRSWCLDSDEVLALERCEDTPKRRTCEKCSYTFPRAEHHYVAKPSPQAKPDGTGVEGASEYERGLLDGMRTASSVCHYKAAFYNATTRGRRMRSWILAKECGDQIDEMMAQERKDWPELHQRAAFNPKVREAERAARDGSK